MENRPVKSSIPTLILNGAYDDVTPVSWGRQLQQQLENSYQAVFPGYRHGISTYWDNPCGMEMANAFFNDPTRQPNMECFTKIKKVKFVSE